jgi:hypothetical protein
MKATHAPHGKICCHFEGLGAASRDTVRQRAREIALINGRPPNHFTEDDFLEAKRELMGATGDGEPGDALERLTRWDEAPETHGHPVEKSEPADEQAFDAELVEEGLNEAEHDQMVEGAKTHND